MQYSSAVFQDLGGIHSSDVLILRHCIHLPQPGYVHHPERMGYRRTVTRIGYVYKRMEISRS